MGLRHLRPSVRQNPFIKESSGLRLEITAEIIHGFNYFIDIVESATTVLGVPFAAGVVLFCLIWGRQYAERYLVSLKGLTTCRPNAWLPNGRESFRTSTSTANSSLLFCVLFDRLPVLLGLGNTLGRTARV